MMSEQKQLEDGLIRQYDIEKEKRGGGVALFSKGRDYFTFYYHGSMYESTYVEAIIKKRKSY